MSVRNYDIKPVWFKFTFNYLLVLPEYLVMFNTLYAKERLVWTVLLSTPHCVKYVRLHVKKVKEHLKIGMLGVFSSKFGVVSYIRLPICGCHIAWKRRNGLTFMFLVWGCVQRLKLLDLFNNKIKRWKWWIQFALHLRFIWCRTGVKDSDPSIFFSILLLSFAFFGTFWVAVVI